MVNINKYRLINLLKYQYKFIVHIKKEYFLNDASLGLVNIRECVYFEKINLSDWQEIFININVIVPLGSLFCFI